MIHLLHQEWNQKQTRNKKQPTDRIRCHALPELYPVASPYCKRRFLSGVSLLFSWPGPSHILQSNVVWCTNGLGAALLCIANSPIVASCNRCICV